MTCALCRTRVKTWAGSDPTCAFPSDGVGFQTNNWNCATLGTLRLLFAMEGPGAVGQTGHQTFYEDQWTCTIDLRETGDNLPSGPAQTLWFTHYKSRGRTDALWLLNEEGLPRRPTEQDILSIVENFR